MDAVSIYGILREITVAIAAKDPGFPALPPRPDPAASLNDVGLDIITLPDVLGDLKKRLGGKDLGLDRLLNPADLNAMTVGTLLRHIGQALGSGTRNPIVVYVDDEEENLFVFKRKFGKRLNLKTFPDPLQALEFIRREEDVALVITDEVMPELSGNQLCDEVHRIKPKMKFILITGNPNNDEDLMYRSLRKNRFYEFINKPVDFEGKGEDYFNMIQGLIHFEW